MRNMKPLYLSRISVDACQDTPWTAISDSRAHYTNLLLELTAHDDSFVWSWRWDSQTMSCLLVIQGGSDQSHPAYVQGVQEMGSSHLPLPLPGTTSPEHYVFAPTHHLRTWRSSLPDEHDRRRKHSSIAISAVIIGLQLERWSWCQIKERKTLTSNPTAPKILRVFLGGRNDTSCNAKSQRQIS